VLCFSEELTAEEYLFLATTASANHLDNGNNNDQRRRLFVRKGICLLSCFAFMTSFKAFLKKLFELTHAQECWTATPSTPSTAFTALGRLAHSPIRWAASRDTTPSAATTVVTTNRNSNGSSKNCNKNSNSKNNSNWIPIERLVCNFLDDVPAPPAGRVAVTCFVGDEPISFRRPPPNEPNVWSGFPLFPLFECLSAQSIASFLAVLLTERQVLLVSSQYALLTLCAEAITSLLFPFKWVHAYIPILPTSLLGVLGAPFPFIFGIHVDTYRSHQSMISDETVVVFLDDDRIHFGACGSPPLLPDRRLAKLLAHINTVIPWNNP
jgi:hypothetical protein